MNEINPYFDSFTRTTWFGQRWLSEVLKLKVVDTVGGDW